MELHSITPSPVRHALGRGDVARIVHCPRRRDPSPANAGRDRDRAAPARRDRPVGARGRRAAAIPEPRKKRDEIGLVFGFDLFGERIGTIRIVPMGYGLNLTETLLEQLGSAAPPLLDGDWEVGRLVLAPEYRTDVDALKRCLFLALDYARHNAPVHRLFASCTHVLSRLYRRFGFTAFAREVPLPGTSKTYTLIAGGQHEVGVALGGRAVDLTQ